jgi:hypothetical protein
MFVISYSVCPCRPFQPRGEGKEPMNVCNKLECLSLSDLSSLVGKELSIQIFVLSWSVCPWQTCPTLRLREGPYECL